MVFTFIYPGSSWISKNWSDIYLYLNDKSFQSATNIYISTGVAIVENKQKRIQTRWIQLVGKYCYRLKICILGLEICSVSHQQTPTPILFVNGWKAYNMNVRYCYYYYYLPLQGTILHLDKSNIIH